MKQINFEYVLKNLLPASTRFSEWLIQLVTMLAGFLQDLFTLNKLKVDDYTEFAETPTYVHTVTKYLRGKLNNNTIIITNHQVYMPLVLYQKIEQKQVKLYQISEGIGVPTLQLNETQQPYNFIVRIHINSGQIFLLDFLNIYIKEFLILGTNYKIEQI